VACPQGRLLGSNRVTRLKQKLAEFNNDITENLWTTFPQTDC